jgi:hypothetical protein
MPIATRPGNPPAAPHSRAEPGRKRVRIGAARPAARAGAPARTRRPHAARRHRPGADRRRAGLAPGGDAPLGAAGCAGEAREDGAPVGTAVPRRRGQWHGGRGAPRGAAGCAGEAREDGAPVGTIVPRRRVRGDGEAMGSQRAGRRGGAKRSGAPVGTAVPRRRGQRHGGRGAPRGAVGCAGEAREDGAPDRIRTCDPYLRRVVLYPAELRARGCGF